MLSLATLTDDQLLDGLHGLNGKHCALMASILQYLGEVDERRLHLRLGYSSLFEYCAKVLGLTEDEAYRRIAVARMARRWPEILVGISSGELTLSGVALLRPHMESENSAELLALARNSSKRGIEAKLAARFPREDVADSLRRACEGTERPERPSKVAPLSAERFHLQLTIGSETQRKLARALDLMSHTNPGRAFEPVLDRALETLLTALEREKRATLKSAARTRERSKPAVTAARSLLVQTEIPGAGATPIRAIARPVRRAVFERDGARCTFKSADGHVCGASAFLEIDHGDPWSLGGASGAANLRVYCRAHNQLTAEEFFGRRRRRGG